MKLFISKLTFFTFGFLLLKIAGFGQVTNKASIKGSVKDSNTNKALGYVTVGLYKVEQQDKALRNIFTSDKGEFIFTNVDTGNYVVIAVYTGYNEKISAPVTVTNSQTIQLPAFLLSQAAKDLQAVTVTSTRKPLLERTEDKLIFNAESDPTLDGQQATDVLRKTPFLSVDNDGNVTLNGQSNFKILLNGKESSMFAKDPKEALKAFPASLIKRIEVITQPSAKYDAEGIAGIINIITKRKVVGYNGSIGIYANSIGNRNLNSNFNVKYGNLGFSGYVGMGGANNVPGSSESVTNYTDPNSLYSKRVLLGDKNNGWAWKNGNLELSYDIDSLNTISSYLNLGGGNNHFNVDQVSYLIGQMNDTAKSILNSQDKSTYPYTDWGIDYIRKFSGKEDQEFTFRFNQETGNDNDDNSSQQYQSSLYRNVLNTSLSQNKQYTLQTDFILPLSKKLKQKIEMGAKAVIRRAESDYQSQFTYTPGGKFEVDSMNTNIFNYDQNILAVYSTYGITVNKTYIKAGLRTEWSNLGGEFESGQSTVTQHYVNFVPTLFISQNLKGNKTLTLNYNIRLQRPYITDLNPFVNNADSLNVRFGNPNLKPQLIHNLEFGFSYFKNQNSINVKLNTFYSDNQITEYGVYAPSTGITYWTKGNIGKNYGAFLSGFISVKPQTWWTINANLGIRYDYVINTINTAVKNQGFSGWGNANTAFDLSKKIAISGNVGMNKGRISLQQNPGLNYWYGAGLVYKMFDNKLRVSLRCDNFLQDKMTWKSTSTGTNFNGYQETISPGRALAVAVRWNFGKLSDNTSKKRGVSTDDVKK